MPHPLWKHCSKKKKDEKSLKIVVFLPTLCGSIVGKKKDEKSLKIVCFSFPPCHCTIFQLSTSVILFCFYYKVTQFATRREEEVEDGDQVGWC
jgi:hypothetical protein